MHRNEIVDLFVSWIGVSIAVAISLFPGGMFLRSLLIGSVTVGFGFLFHELAHKIVAQHYKCHAEYVSNLKMILLSIFISFTGILFMAPGGVLINGRVSRRENAMISLAGPVANLCMAITFLFIPYIGIFGFYINSLLALFNMIPFGFFDGKKVFDYNKRLYVLFVIICAVFLFFSNI